MSISHHHDSFKVGLTKIIINFTCLLVLSLVLSLALVGVVSLFENGFEPINLNRFRPRFLGYSWVYAVINGDAGLGKRKKWLIFIIGFVFLLALSILLAHPWEVLVQDVTIPVWLWLIGLLLGIGMIIYLLNHCYQPKNNLS